MRGYAEDFALVRCPSCRARAAVHWADDGLRLACPACGHAKTAVWSGRHYERGPNMLGAVATLACGSVVSALAPDLAVLIAAQAIAGLGIGVSYSAAVAATAEWSTAANRSRVLALTLLGPPLAWIIGMQP